MGAVPTAFLTGFRGLLACAGERLVLPSGVVVLGLVRRDVVAQARRAGLPDYTSKASVLIEIERVTPKPAAGESLRLASNPVKRFRVREVLEETEHTLRMSCEPYEVAS